VKLSALLVVNALVATVFGVGFVVAPGQVTSFYSREVTPQLEYVSQLLGAAFLAFAALTWMVRNAPESEVRRAILLALFIGNGIGFVISLIGQLGGVVNALGWSTVAIYLLLALGFGYFCFAQPRARDEAGPVM
jgi:uncharacterized protein involved in cysteine biosynthesis